MCLHAMKNILLLFLQMCNYFGVLLNSLMVLPIGFCFRISFLSSLACEHFVYFPSLIVSLRMHFLILEMYN